MKKTTLEFMLLAILVVSCLMLTACHSCEFGEWTVIEQATCTEAGLKVRVCECGESKTEIIPAGHSYTSVVTAPTCTEQGFTTHICAGCGDSYIDVLEATGHNYSDIVTPPTCMEQGFTTHTCAGCGDSYIDAYVDALGHDEIEHTAKTATCTEIGWDAYVACSRCDYSTYSEILTVHNFQQSDTCENCGQNIADVAVDYFDMSATEDDNIKCYVIPRPDDKCDAYIKGTGAMEDYYYNGNGYNLPFFHKAYTIATAYISSGVTSIGDCAFYDCYRLTSIVISDSVTTIGSSAFSSCDSLTSVTIGNSVTTIGNCAFGGCRSLASIVIPDSVTTIGSATFRDCDSLTSIVIPDSVTTIGSYAFSGCTSLTYNVYDNGKYLGNESNPYLVLVKATSTSITSCEINENCKFIQDDAFSHCTDLTSIVIPDSVTSIGVEAFYGCFNLTSIVIRDSVTTIGAWAFSGCFNLTSVTFGENSKLTAIGAWAFYNCDSLTSIVIPDSVTTIGASAFYDCDRLTDVYYTGTEEQWNNITIASTNYNLVNATIHYNYTGEEN